jgi:hypothetical protein
VSSPALYDSAEALDLYEGTQAMIRSGKLLGAALLDEAAGGGTWWPASLSAVDRGKCIAATRAMIKTFTDNIRNECDGVDDVNAGTTKEVLGNVVAVRRDLLQRLLGGDLAFVEAFGKWADDYRANDVDKCVDARQDGRDKLRSMYNEQGAALIAQGAALNLTAEQFK